MKAKGFFQDSKGDWSSTRLAGLACIFAGIIGFLLDLIPKLEVNHIALDIMIVAGITLLGVKDWKKKSVE